MIRCIKCGCPKCVDGRLQVERQRAAIALLTTSVVHDIGKPTARLVLDLLSGNADEAVTAMETSRTSKDWRRRGGDDG